MTTDNPWADLRTIVRQMAETRSASARARLLDDVNSAIHACATGAPPPDAAAAERRGYERGLLEALTLERKARIEVNGELNGPWPGDKVGVFGQVVAGAKHYGEAVSHAFEHAVQKALHPKTEP